MSQFKTSVYRVLLVVKISGSSHTRHTCGLILSSWSCRVYLVGVSPAKDQLQCVFYTWQVLRHHPPDEGQIRLHFAARSTYNPLAVAGGLRLRDAHYFWTGKYCVGMLLKTRPCTCRSWPSHMTTDKVKPRSDLLIRLQCMHLSLSASSGPWMYDTRKRGFRCRSGCRGRRALLSASLSRPH